MRAAESAEVDEQGVSAEVENSNFAIRYTASVDERFDGLKHWEMLRRQTNADRCVSVEVAYAEYDRKVV